MPDRPLSTPQSTVQALDYSATHSTQQEAQQNEVQHSKDASKGGLTASDSTTSSQQSGQRQNAMNDPSLTSTNSALSDVDPQGRSYSKEIYTLDDLPLLTSTLSAALKQYQDFPTPGILFEDILPIFADPTLHQNLLTALDLLITSSFFAQAAVPGPLSDSDRFQGDQVRSSNSQTSPSQHNFAHLPIHSNSTSPPNVPSQPKSQSWPSPPYHHPDLILGLEARGFLFGPALALKLNAGFIAVRKPGKLPGPTLKAGFTKEYGQDGFEIQAEGPGAIKKGQKVVVVDDILATGGSATAAGQLVEKAGGVLVGYVFLLELGFLKGRERLEGQAKVVTLLKGQGEEGK